ADGDANAQAQLGFIYDSGRGLPRDPDRAHFWYMKAAGQGHTDAQAMVGYQFQSGHGIPRKREFGATHPTPQNGPPLWSFADGAR
ncbi:MAG: tetratricopeptide repeat protein, partial [Nannocystaceae bacterium]